jgi:hypothetical protein
MDTKYYIAIACLLLPADFYAGVEQEIQDSIFPDLPECGLTEALDQLRQGINLVYKFSTGKEAIEETFVLGEEPVKPKPQMLPLRFEGSANPVIKMRNCFGKFYFFEVTADDDASGGRATYQDEKGRIQDVVWGADRIIQHDSHPKRYFLNTVVPTKYEMEEKKSLDNMIGHTSSIVKRNGTGGIEKIDGSISEQVFKLQSSLDKVNRTWSADIQKMKDYFYSGLCLVNNNVNRLEEKVASLSESVGEAYSALEQLLKVLKKSKIVVPCEKKKHRCGGCCTDEDEVDDDANSDSCFRFYL